MNQGPSSRAELPADLEAAVALGSEMGRRFAEFDWAAHPLGRPPDWPAEMRTIVAVALTSRFPMAMFLGTQDLFQIYNDDFIPILGDKHPAALGRVGREVWWDVWESSIGPMLTGVTDTGAAIWSDDLMVPLVTGGRPQERFFTFSYSPLVANAGEVYGVFCAVTETTERVLSERRLHLLNAVAAAVIGTRTIDEAVAAAVAVCGDQPEDLPFVAAYVGDTGLRGATPSVLPFLPRTLADLTGGLQPESRAVWIIENVASVIPGILGALGSDCPDQALVLALGEGPTAGALVVGVSPRLPLDALYRGFCQLLADQLLATFAAVVSYEHERQRADGLAELDRAKSAFLTNVSHEFRTPLTLLLGPLDDALADAGPNTVLADRLSTARRNAQRLLRMVDSLLDFSRIEAGRATVRLVCTDVGALTAHIASSFTELCERAGLEFTLDCDPALADVDPGMWETIVLNLLSNAVKYTLRGSISVEVRAEAADCRIALRDTGVGISAKDLDRLFERFYRVEDSRGRSVEGSGIGLSLVRGLVELQRGTVEIDSEPDRGTTVTICVPRSMDGTAVQYSPDGQLDESNPYVADAHQWVASSPETLVRKARRSIAVPARERRGLILIADDNADMRAHLDRVLSPHWETVLVADGRSALDATRELRPDAIVTDVMMPGLDGFELVAAIRAEPELAGTPMLMLSARAGAEAVSDGFAGGADDYLPKPFRSQELIDRVSARLSAGARERAGQERDAELRLSSEFDAALHGADSVAGILTVLLDPRFGLGAATAAAIGLRDPEEDNVRFEYGGVFPAELRDRYHVAPRGAPLVAVDVIKLGEPMVVTDTFDLPPRYDHAVQDTASSVRACVIQPLRDGLGRIIGVLSLLWSQPRPFSAAELDMFAHAAEMTQSALERVRAMAREHRIAVEFQEQLLDLDRGSTAAAVAAIYQPAGEAMRVGGDWYLVTPLNRPGQIGISAGDVVGHGLPGATVMSRLRAAVGATALSQADPAVVLSTLDTYAATVPGARCATVAYALVDVMDAESGCPATISYSCAGHPYPLLVDPDPDVGPVYLEGGRRTPVATGRVKPTDSTAQAELAPGTLVLLYTDGLIERPGEALDDGFDRLKATAAECAHLAVNDVCAELLRRMAPPGGYRDDVVVLALRPSHSGPHSFTIVVPARETEVPVVRDRLHAWLTALTDPGVDPSRAQDILLAVGEAVTNGIEHGSHCDPRRTVSLEAFIRDTTIAVTVADSGRWSGDSSASLRSDRRGRGLTLMSGLADRVDTVRDRWGTRVTMRFGHAVVGSKS
jgi:signal transduction histidine kinase/CheY-like chemotaxis protein